MTRAKCLPENWCDSMMTALDKVARGALFETETVDLKTGKFTGVTVALRTKGGRLCPLYFCPWCREPLTKGRT